MLQIIQHRKYNYIFSLILLVIALYSMAVWGFRYAIDFTGGSLLELDFKIERPAAQDIQDNLAKLDLGPVTIQPAGDTSAILRLENIDEKKHQEILKTLNDAYKKDSNVAFEEKSFSSIGPTIGRELRNKTIVAIFIALLAIIAYIAFAFRKVSFPVASWKYGVAAIIALGHDTLVLLGSFSLLGHFLGIEIDSLFVTALLTLIGFSVHDTIVVFDRIRENILRYHAADFESAVNKSVNDTLARSINTSLTVLLVMLAVYIFGGETVRYFSLALIIGIIIGTYSSIFVASPIVVDWYRFDLARKKK